MITMKITTLLLTPLCVLVLLIPVRELVGQSTIPRVFLIDGAALVQAKQSYRAGKSEYLDAVKSTVKEADKALKESPVSVTQKKQLPPSGDRHDYMSVAPYWWPDPSKPDGLPYIRKDGEVNPERGTIGDRIRIGTLTANVFSLGLAYYFTEDEKYATHAARFLGTWFLDKETRMNPNLEFAQAVPGRNAGRGAGIIDGHGFRELIDGVGLLDGSKSWTKSDQQELVSWFTRYLDWLLTSKNGKEEAVAKNNHGTTYAVQVSCIALFVGKEEIARSFVESMKERIVNQVEPDGSQPHELVRTKSWNYSMLNLESLMRMAWIGERFGIDLWSFRSTDGRGIQAALEYLIPSGVDGKKWNYPQIARMETERLFPVLRIAARKCNDQRYARLSKQLDSKNPVVMVSKLLYSEP